MSVDSHERCKFGTQGSEESDVSSNSKSHQSTRTKSYETDKSKSVEFMRHCQRKWKQKQASKGKEIDGHSNGVNDQNMSQPMRSNHRLVSSGSTFLQQPKSSETSNDMRIPIESQNSLNLNHNHNHNSNHQQQQQQQEQLQSQHQIQLQFQQPNYSTCQAHLQSLIPSDGLGVNQQQQQQRQRRDTTTSTARLVRQSDRNFLDSDGSTSRKLMDRRQPPPPIAAATPAATPVFESSLTQLANPPPYSLGATRMAPPADQTRHIHIPMPLSAMINGAQQVRGGANMMDSTAHCLRQSQSLQLNHRAPSGSPSPMNAARRLGAAQSGNKKPKNCFTCSDISIKWYIVVIALFGLICALIGTIVGAVHSAGRDYISLSLLLTGVGFVLIAISWTALRITIKTYKNQQIDSASRILSIHSDLPQMQSANRISSFNSASLSQQRTNERLYLMALASNPRIFTGGDSRSCSNDSQAFLSRLRQNVGQIWCRLTGSRGECRSNSTNQARSRLNQIDTTSGYLNVAAASLLQQQLALLHHPASVALFGPQLGPAHLFPPALLGADVRPPPPSYHASMIQDHARWRLQQQQQQSLAAARMAGSSRGLTNNTESSEPSSQRQQNPSTRPQTVQVASLPKRSSSPVPGASSVTANQTQASSEDQSSETQAKSQSRGSPSEIVEYFGYL